MRKIVVVPYNPDWPEQYRAEAVKIAAVFGPELVTIHHIGSTSVPGLSAKPIIDMMPVVCDITAVDLFNPAMIRLGYQPKGENGIPGRRYFVKGSDASRTHHVHIFALDNPEVKRHLDFRDYLIAHPAEAQRYAALKAELAWQFPHDIHSYMAGKNGFIKEAIQMNNILNEIRQELKQNADEHTQRSGQTFFKEQVQLYGVKTAVVSKIGKECFKEIRDRGKTEIFELCEDLWQSGYLEESFIACNWSYFLRKDYEPQDFPVFERWVNDYISNWATCDTLCNHTVGSFLEMYPAYLSNLKTWGASPNRWARRAAAVSLIVPARQGKFLPTIFEIADILLLDKDDLVQKGYGWMLKAASQARQQEVFEYVLAHKATMPRTALRYAIEKMPKELKNKAMEKL